MSNYDMILLEGDPRYIDTVSMLRHYRNVYESLSKPSKYFGVETKLLSRICEIASGSILVKDAIVNMDELERKVLEKQRHLELNKQSVVDLKVSRNNFCGIGTRKVKLLLNRLIKQGDQVAEMYRVALEAEDWSIKAKGCEWYQYVDKMYYKKALQISKLIDLVESWNECHDTDDRIIYGLGNSDAKETTHVIYFEFPGCEQISFHYSPGDMENTIPVYEGEWDGLVNSTLKKLECAISTKYRYLLV